MKKIVVWFSALLISVFTLSIIGYCAYDASSCKLDPSSVSAASELVGNSYEAKQDKPWTAYFKVSNSKFCMSSDINDLSVADCQDVLEEFVYALNDDSLKISKESKQAMYATVQNGIRSDIAPLLSKIVDGIKPDIWGASAFIYPFSSVIGTVLGVVTIIIITLLIFSTFCDMAYLSSAGTIETLSEDIFDSEHPPFVSREAIITAKEYHEGKVIQNIYLLYFKKRCITYIVLAVAILYLISGQISTLISWILGLASGITS